MASSNLPRCTQEISSYGTKRHLFSDGGLILDSRRDESIELSFCLVLHDVEDAEKIFNTLNKLLNQFLAEK